MEGFFVNASYFNEEGQETVKWDEEKAYEDTSLQEWKEVFITMDTVQAIGPTRFADRNQSLIYLKSGDTFIVEGNPRQVVDHIQARRFVLKD